MIPWKRARTQKKEAERHALFEDINKNEREIEAI